MIITRDKYLAEIMRFKDTEFIKVITGVRRAGKSSLMAMYREHLKALGVADEHIVYINFENLEAIKLRDKQPLIDYLLANSDKATKMYYLFDEIQFVEEWEDVINGLRVTFDADITVTGSNAKLLSGEIATLLSGRYVAFEILPLSFKEFLQFKQLDSQDYRHYPKWFAEYRRYGGFPAVVLAEEQSKEIILSGILDTVLLHDVGYRAEIKDTEVLMAINRYLMFNAGQIISMANISNTLTSARVKTTIPTINRYLGMLVNAYLFSAANRYDLRGKQYLRAQPKYYPIDTGLRNITLGKSGDNQGSELEGIVYNELKRRGYSVDVGQLANGKEIDFVARKMEEILYVQVTQEIPVASDRETDNLIRVPGNYDKLLITGVQSLPDSIDGIPVRNVYEWLLDD
ncbi:MAG: ATP-binding protein [Lactobacillaceae bacterium]|jgi:predicted AAA+ superfamily ATPase|nr:ATP-binding protein [Lactobacillaceae bacterium]